MKTTLEQSLELLRATTNALLPKLKEITKKHKTPRYLLNATINQIVGRGGLDKDTYSALNAFTEDGQEISEEQAQEFLEGKKAIGRVNVGDHYIEHPYPRLRFDPDGYIYLSKY